MKKIICYTALGLSLSACAGGVTGGTAGQMPQIPSNNVVTDYPIETAMLNIYTKARQQTLVGVIDGQSLGANITVTPKGSLIFNNKSVQGTEVNTITTLDNEMIDQSVSINYFTLNPLVFHGFTDSSGEYSIATQTSTLPKKAKVGSASQLITEKVYSDSSKRQQVGLYSQSWTLTQDSKTTAWFCIDSSENMLANADPQGATSECYKINAKGDIVDSKLTIQVPTIRGERTVTLLGR